MFSLKVTKKFEKQAKKLPDTIKKGLSKQLIHLEKDPKYPSLRTKPNHTASKMFKIKIYESSINDKYRFLWKYEEKQVILLLVVGDHEVVE